MVVDDRPEAVEGYWRPVPIWGVQLVLESLNTYLYGSESLDSLTPRVYLSLAEEGPCCMGQGSRRTADRTLNEKMYWNSHVFARFLSLFKGLPL
jgi:hypothetical protein